MKKLIGVAFAVLAVMGSSPVAAGEKLYLGAGYTCGGWTQGKNKNDAYEQIGARAYAVGYLSGANIHSSRPDLLKPGVGSVEAYMGWIDNYCRANPLDSIADAADALMDELAKRRR